MASLKGRNEATDAIEIDAEKMTLSTVIGSVDDETGADQDVRILRMPMETRR